MTAAIDPDDTVPVLDEEEHLGVPVVRTKRPAMMEDDRLAMSPILVKNLNAILDRNGTHSDIPFSVLGGAQRERGTSRHGAQDRGRRPGEDGSMGKLNPLGLFRRALGSSAAVQEREA